MNINDLNCKNSMKPTLPEKIAHALTELLLEAVSDDEVPIGYLPRYAPIHCTEGNLWPQLDYVAHAVDNLLPHNTSDGQVPAATG